MTKSVRRKMNMESSYIITVILGAVLLSLIYWIFKWNDSYWGKRGVKYVKFPPLVGSMRDLFLSKKGYLEIYGDIYKNNEGEKFVGYFQLITPSILIRDPELVNYIIVKDFSHFEDRWPSFDSTKDLFSQAFFNFHGVFWRNLRAKLSPGYSINKMKTILVSTMNDCSNNLMDFIDDKGDEDFNARELMLKLVINSVGSIAFGLKINTLDEKDDKSANFLKKISVFFSPPFSIFMKFLISISLPIGRDVLKLEPTDKNVDRFFRSLMKETIKHRLDSGSRRNDFLQLLLDLKQKEKDTQSETEIFTDDFICAQAFTFLSGGGEAVAVVLEFMLYEMAVHQDLQKKVQEEISTMLTSDELTYESINKLTYMEQCLNETLRLHSVSPILFRLCTRDYKIPSTEVVLQKGTFIHICVDGIHKDPLYFHNPEIFDPDRFEDMDSFPKNIYYPFGAGPRMCIGMKLAMFQMKIILAKLLSQYSVTLSKNTKLPLKMAKIGILLHAEGGVWVNFHRRVA